MSQHHKVAADDSPEQMELRLSGLAIKQQGSLSVSNRIYESVFNQIWVDKALSNLRPYAEALEAWVASNYLDDSRLLRGQALHDAQLWVADKSLSDLDYQFLLEAEKKATETERRANQILTEARQKANRRIRLGSLILTMSLIAGIVAGKLLVSKAASEALQNRTSLGDKILVKSNTSLNKKAGVRAFASNNFKTAINEFQVSLQRNRNDPETLIYLNNAIGNGNTLKIVVSVPIGSNPDVAQEILRGVAQAQNEVNLRRDMHGNLLGINGKQLQVEIADDKNDPELAKKLAALFVEDPQILAVVGHNATDVSIAAASVYQNQLVMISPTSFSNSLSEHSNLQNRNYIFRTVSSIIPVADNLANYIINTTHKTHIAICSDFQAVDNNAFRNEFIAQIQRDSGKIFDQGCNFSSLNFNPSDVINQAVKAGADSLLLAPYVDRINKAVELAHANHGRLALFGSPTLDTLETLKSGKVNVNGLVIAEFFDYQALLETKFGKEANKLWGTRVNWRTVMAYDASKAIIKGLEQSNSDRDKLQNVLSKPDFSADGAMGKIQFQPSSGERISHDCNGPTCLIKILPGDNSGTGYDFVSLLNRRL